MLGRPATSQTEACEPGGELEIRKATVLKVPRVHGKLLISTDELMDEIKDKVDAEKKTMCSTKGHDFTGSRHKR